VQPSREALTFSARVSGRHSSPPPVWPKQDTLVVWQPGAIKGEAALVGSYSLAVWRDYLRFPVIDRYAEVLPQSFETLSSELRSVVEGNAPTRRSRERRALDATNNALPNAVGHLYVARYFPSETKAKA
jgi:putative endopeptidase